MRTGVTGWTALPLVLALAAPAMAQDVALSPAPVPVPASDAAAGTLAAGENEIAFSADSVSYDNDNEVVVAAGRVRVNRRGTFVAADQVRWDRKTGEVLATGNVVVVQPEGDKLISERVVLTDELRDATVENLLVVLESGGRIAADKAVRTGDVTTLDNAVYSPCAVTTVGGCPKRPSWRILAARVRYDQKAQRVSFERGRLELFGVSLPLLPVFSLGTGSGGEGYTGALPPEIRYSRRRGVELETPYYLRFGPNRDLTLTPRVYSAVNPALEARYRDLNRLGAFSLGAFVTYGDTTSYDDTRDDKGVRAYVEGNGKLQFDPLWSLTGQVRLATDKTVARFYDLNRDDRFRNFLDLERIDTDSYISLAGWAFQGLRQNDIQKRIPIALPAFDARIRLGEPILGGRVELQANSLAVLRREGQDSQRAFLSARWDLRRLTNWGQELLLTGYARGDVYHSDENELTTTVNYRGESGWKTRGITAAAAEVRWPLMGNFLGGIQRLTPRVQLVLTPPTANISLPNEDSRSVDLEDSNLFAINRFPGYDRWEDGSRITYGVDWNLDRPGWSVSSNVGQSYRLNRDAQIFPEGTGLTDRWSDFVGRTRLKVGRFIDLTHRFRLDKDNLSVRRNEVDLTVGTTETYARIDYLRLNRNVDAAVEDLRDKEELRLAGRWKFSRFWSVFGATVLDLTNSNEDPLSLADGINSVRHRLSLDYEDDCLSFGISWRRDYERLGNRAEGSTFSFRLSLKGLKR
ncbi:LPS-assembly protein LptD [Sphingomonas astaxanthinifaciens]|uniref:LPS-assembly protein LptD n=1 Tax=Sphingomonas astaxanthinifaciens DSM 22298 TaxID=1123267 RepID=A0ABQ5Z0X8_9SPHN|nr:LPS assembly protein LptD [Sphingomonas astaxanthinifaciens]GLR46420.1 LPS-assembly protein LptD [Sphingomonas astaxanthinifaciens DSM 22298]